MVLDGQRGTLEEDGQTAAFLGTGAAFPKIPSGLGRIYEGRSRREKRRSSAGDSTP
ncbi:MAG TPA: hypothetical protein PK156_09605 [Polyangium sp.]|nr:hypothetical protein [Polyangium sp.]